METFEYPVDSAWPGGISVDEPPELSNADLQEHEQSAQDAVSTDDPVRVYLREMGSVRLLNRQGEIDLARHIDRKSVV